tara:strand:- start:782 stop:892 length:111 start_codon:yes stop_codon:yes gene_type:complete
MKKIIKLIKKAFAYCKWIEEEKIRIAIKNNSADGLR